MVGDALIVPDDGEHAVEDGKPRALVRGHVAPHLGHQRTQRKRLEGDGLAARVGAGHQEQERLLARELEIDGYHGPRRILPALDEEQGMTSAADSDTLCSRSMTGALALMRSAR